MENYIFRAMGPEEGARMIEMIRQRIDWMDREGIHSWNTSNYLELYPQDYYEDRARKGQLFALVRPADSKIVCAGVLLDGDERWEDGFPALYIHHLVSDVSERGTGAAFLAQAEDYARRRGIGRLRLDCYEGNAGINAYYEALGFRAAGTCADGPYHGVLREKKIHKEEQL